MAFIRSVQSLPFELQSYGGKAFFVFADGMVAVDRVRSMIEIQEKTDSVVAHTESVQFSSDASTPPLVNRKFFQGLDRNQG